MNPDSAATAAATSAAATAVCPLRGIGRRYQRTKGLPITSRMPCWRTESIPRETPTPTTASLGSEPTAARGCIGSSVADRPRERRPMTMWLLPRFRPTIPRGPRRARILQR